MTTFYALIFDLDQVTSPSSFFTLSLVTSLSNFFTFSLVTSPSGFFTFSQVPSPSVKFLCLQSWWDFVGRWPWSGYFAFKLLHLQSGYFAFKLLHLQSGYSAFKLFHLQSGYFAFGLLHLQSIRLFHPSILTWISLLSRTNSVLWSSGMSPSCFCFSSQAEGNHRPLSHHRIS